MATIQEVKRVSLENLVIGKGQVRVSDVKKDITELADSIQKIGLLEPIVVCPAEKPGKYEILNGQRRFLAHQELKKETILAAILDDRVDEITAKVISISKHLIRRHLTRKDLIDACTLLYKQYGTIKAVAEETGLPANKVSEYVKYDRLCPELRTLVENGQVDVKVALRAQDAASISGELKSDEAVKLAKEMSPMSGAQQAKLIKGIKESPSAPLDERIEAAKTGEKITQVVVTLGAAAHHALGAFAKAEGTNIDDAARTLIEDSLSQQGLLEG